MITRSWPTLALVAALAAPVAAGAAAPDEGDRVARPAAKAGKALDDRDLKRKGAWAKKTSATAYKKTLSKSKDKGAKLSSKESTTKGGSVTFQFGPDRGKADILVGGVKKKTVDTDANTVKLKVVTFKGSGKLTIKVRKPRTGGVWVDKAKLARVEPGVPAPGVGDVIVTEWLAEPTDIVPQLAEWFELHNVTSGPLSLDTCRVDDQGSGTVDLPAAVLPAGEPFVLDRNADPATNGGVVADATFGFPLANSSASLTVACGGVVVDTVTWNSTTEGQTASLDPDHYSALDNDAESNFCLGSVPYGPPTGDYGTPGSVNSQCP